MMKPQITAFVSQEHFLSVLVIASEKGNTVTVYRQYNNDVEIVRGAKAVTMKNVEQLVIDYEVPQGVPITYWVVASDGKDQQESTRVVTGPYNFGRDILFDLGDPRRGMRVWVETFDEYDYGISRDVQHVWGRRDPVVISGVREMFTSALGLLTLELPERANLLEIIKNGSTVAMSPNKPEFGLEGVMYYAVGDVKESRLPGAVAGEPTRRWTMDVQQIQAPPAEYRYPSYGITWRQMRDKYWVDYAANQWWEPVAR